MNNSLAVKMALLPFMGAFVVAGCNSSSGGTSNSSVVAANTAGGSGDVTTTAAPTEEPLRSNTGAQVKPPAGLGNAQGRVLWNEKPASGIKVQLCETVSFIGGCGGKTFTATTDKDGNYTVDKVAPGEYGLAVQVFDTDTFVYPTSGILSAAKYTIVAGETLDIRATNLFKTDLQTISPKVGETVKSGTPELSWKPYQGATEYEVRLSPKGSGAEMQSMKTSETKVAPENPLLNGDYKWEVVARNANGVKIAETRSETPFKVAGQAGSAKIVLESPRVGTSVVGNGLVLKWQKHPLADVYQIYLNAENGKTPILSFEEVQTNSYTVSKTLESGLYFWSVNAKRGGKQVAASELESFRVK
ncbi:hypothetical protein EON83_26255 [bacterium]|nr:MAG: hypothetical protein EON83_26255 [bacterium]